MNKTAHAQLADQLDVFLQSIKMVNKQAESDNTDTSHPSASVDDNTQPASEGARSAENSADIKDQIGGTPVDSAAKATNDNTSNPPYKDLNARPTGEGPQKKPDSRPEDPGTSHPANTSVGDKYSSLINKSNNILDSLSNLVKDAGGKKKNEPNAAPMAPANASAVENTPAETPATPENKAAMAGYKAATVLLEAMGLDKEAEANQLIVLNDVITNIQKSAALDAVKAADFIYGYFSQKLAQEMEAGAPPMDPAAGAPMDPAAGGPPMGGDPAQELAMIVQALLQAGVTPEMLLEFAEQIAGAQGGGGEPAPEGTPADMAQDVGAPVEQAKVAAMTRVVNMIMEKGAQQALKNKRNRA